MYTVIVFALALLSPMPFISPFEFSVQDATAQLPFGPFEPTTSPSLVSEQDSHPFGLENDLVHSPAGTFYHDNVGYITIPVIDNHTYAVTSSSSGTNITNITNITSPTIVSNIPPHSGVSLFKPDDIKHIVIDNSTYVLGADNLGYFHIANISNVGNPDPLYRSNLNSVPGNVYPLTSHPVIINESPYVLLGNFNGGIIIMSIASPNNPNLVYYIKDVTQNSSSEYTQLARVAAITSVTIEESVYVLATNARNGGNYGLTIINITTPSSPSLVYNGTLGIAQSFYVDTVTIDESIYAIVQVGFPQSIVIINITNPYSPEVASTVANGDVGYAQMNNPSRIATTTFGTSTFALVTNQNGANSGIQIINITDPYAPSPTSAITQGQDNYTHLNQAFDINIVTLDGQTYALAAGANSDGVQIIKLDYGTVISLTSSNSNPAYATEGDMLNLAFSVTRSPFSSSVKILGIVASGSVSGKDGTASISVGSEEIEKYVNFTATLTFGNTVLEITADDLHSNIFVDTKRPRISLIGDEHITVSAFTEESSIPGAIVTDEDPNYNGTYTLTTNGTLSTALDGSVILFTYTAANDSIGNVGHSINRTVTVGQPNMIHITSLSIASSSNDNFARAGQNIIVSIDTDGSEIGNFTGTIFGKQFTSAVNGGSANFTVMATPDDPYENATFLITLTNTTGHNITITNSHITDDSYITVDAVSPTLTLHDPDIVTVFAGTTYVDPGATAYDASYGNMTVIGTGTVDTSILGAYTLSYKAPDDAAGNTGQIVDRTVTVITKPFGFISTFSVSPGPLLDSTTLNDTLFGDTHAIKSVQINDSTYIIVGSNPPRDDFYIINITDIDSPRLVNKTIFPNGLNGFQIYYIAISTIDGNTYAIASTLSNNVLIINISNPESPSLVTYVTDGQTFTTLANTSRIAITTMDEFTYALVASRDDNGVQIINITNPANPTPVTAITDKENGGDYDLLQGAEDIAIINANGLVYALVTARDDDGVQIIDITDISNPIPVSSIVDNVVNSSSPYTKLDGAFAIDTIGIGGSIYALVTSYDDFGTQIINITNPESPSKVSVSGNTSNFDANYDITIINLGGYIYTLSTSPTAGGMLISDITNPANPQHVDRLSSDLPPYYFSLTRASMIITVTLNTSTYALISSTHTNGIEVINLNLSHNVFVNSNNPNSAYAKTGDNLSIGFMVTDTISNGNATILGLDAHVSHVGENFTASIIVPSTVQEGYATFTATLENNYNITIGLTQDDFTGSNVFVDNVGPKISLDGSDPYYLVQNRSINTIPNATATDGDPKYLGGYDITTSNTLNTSKIGSTAIYTYTAHPDNIGNLGESVTRNVTVSNFIPFTNVSLTATSNSNSDPYVKAGDTIQLYLATDSPGPNNATGNILGDDNFTVDVFTSTFTILLEKTITQNDTNGNLTFNILATNDNDQGIYITQNDLDADNNIIIDTVPPIIYLYGTNNTISGLGLPYVDPGAVSYDLSYGIQNVAGTGTVNTNLAGTYNIVYNALDDAGNSATITRTVHVQSLAPLSLTNETSQFLVSPTMTVTDSANYPLLRDSYTVTTTKIASFTYALIGSYADDGFTILDISTPDSPTLVFNATGNARINANIDSPTGISVIQIQNSVYAVITSLDTSRITILNITNPTLPVVRSITTLNDNANIDKPFAVSTVDIDGSAYALIASKDNSRIVIFNITNTTNLEQVAVLQDGADYTLGSIRDITPITIDGSTYILTAARGDNSIGIIDIGNPKMPKQVALITDNNTLALTLANSIELASINDRTYALVAAPGESAMQIIDVTHPTLPFPVSTARHGAQYPALSGPHDVTTIQVENSTYALLSSPSADSVQIIDITNPASPSPASDITQGTVYTHLDRPQSLKAVQIDSTAYALVASRDSDGIQIIQLEHEKTIQTPFSITGNGANSSYAKTGDTISVQVTVNDTIYSHTAQILNLETNITVDPNTINASAMIQSLNVEGYANFTISLANYLGVTLDLTQTNLAENVFIDTIPPTITLIGDANHTVFFNSSYVDPGAVASDGDPNYAGTYTVTDSGSLNTSMVGSSIISTYTADSDGAGNPGSSVTRNVTVIDYNPLDIISLTVSSDNSNNSYAKAGDKIRLFITTNNVTSATGVILGDDNFTVILFESAVILEKTIHQNDANGNITFDIFVANSTGYAARVTQIDLTIDNIIIDTIQPNITLIGNNNTVSVLNHPYLDANATAFDLSYGSKIVQSSETVNIAVEGNNTLTYTAPDDYAGNTGLSITRNVMVVDFPPIELQALSITSSNTNNSYAKAGDTITVRLSINDTITAFDVEIFNDTLSPTVINSTNDLNASITVPTSMVEKYATFNITVKNEHGIELYVTQDDLSVNSIFIDTIPPTITLNGNATYAVLVNSSYTDPGAVASDGDSNYTGTYTVTNSGSLNTSMVGSSIISTYTADSDWAGNPGSSVTRTVTVIDYGPLNITSLTASSNNFNTSYAKAGNTITITLVTDGTDITNATGQILGDDISEQSSPSGTITFSKTITSSDTNGELPFNIRVSNSTDYAATVTNNNLASGNNVIIDTISPTITLNGNNNTVVEFGSTYTDPGAVASDASYTTTTVSGTPLVNTTQLGQQTISYKAPNDPASNLGPTITRIITVSDSTPAMLDSLNINTTNNNLAYAKTGETLTITLVANEPISTATVLIQNMQVTPMIQNDTLFANYTIQDGQQGNATFEITANFDSSLPLTVNDVNLTSENIFIDTQKPVINLGGPSNTTTSVNRDYIDYNVTVTDNDPAYTGTISNTTDLDTTVPGTYTITYTAPSDPAGNIPDDATRTIIVSDFVLEIISNNANDKYLAKSGDMLTITIISDAFDGAAITSATIFGDVANASMNITDGVGTVNITVLESHPNGNVTFAILLDPLSGEDLTITHDDLTAANVIIDKISPTIISSETTAPRLISVYFNEPMRVLPGANQFVFITSSLGVSIDTLSIQNDTILEITLSNSLESNDTPQIDFFTSSLAPLITDLAGNALETITITVSDKIPPSIKSAMITSSSFILVDFDESISVQGAPFVTPFPTINDVSAVSPPTISGTTTLTISGNFPANTILNISFVENTNIIDAAGNSFTGGYILTNNTRDLVPYTISDEEIIIPYNMSIDVSTLSPSDYTVSYTSGATGVIDTVTLSTDGTLVTILMSTPFGTATTPTIEQTGVIAGIGGDNVALDSIVAKDRAPPTIISALLTGTTSLNITFSEQVSSASTTVTSYDITGTSVIAAQQSADLKSILLSTNPFSSGTVSFAIPIEDILENESDLQEFKGIEKL